MTERYLDVTVAIVASYVSNNAIGAHEFPGLIRVVHSALENLGKPAFEAPAEAPTTATATQIRKSISREKLISFEDGKPYKTLKRHLSLHGLTPDAYRQKWGLPRDYPMVTPEYSERRSALALTIGFGQKGRMAKPKAARGSD